MDSWLLEQEELARAATTARAESRQRRRVFMGLRQSHGPPPATPNLRLPARPKGVTFGPTGMRVIVNDEPRETAAGTLAALLEELGCAQEAAVAAAVDGQVVPRSRWSAQVLVAGAQILVIRAAQGG